MRPRFIDRLLALRNDLLSIVNLWVSPFKPSLDIWDLRHGIPELFHKSFIKMQMLTLALSEHRRFRNNDRQRNHIQYAADISL
ncbi:Uncharacterised protein [Vibrio cholerae]|nr:Uncharacterised protein [Vibrio cholerae]